MHEDSRKQFTLTISINSNDENWTFAWDHAQLWVMNYFRRTLPSLDALVFLETAARLGNFTRAAEELHVSQVAVSKRIRQLESDIGVPLFKRLGRSLELTAEGMAFAERARAGLSFLEDAISVARRGPRRQRPVIQIAANENINFFWLEPLVREFQMAGDEAIVSVLTANNVADVVRAETDLAIFHGMAPPAGWRTQLLFDEVIAPVASPNLKLRLDGKPGLETALLDYRKESPEWVNWESPAVSALRLRFPDKNPTVCSSYIQSVGLAADGKGVALGVLPMLARDIAAGRLTPLSGSPIVTGRRYFLGTPEGRIVSDAATRLAGILVSAAKRSVSSSHRDQL